MPHVHDVSSRCACSEGPRPPGGPASRCREAPPATAPPPPRLRRPRARAPLAAGSRVCRRTPRARRGGFPGHPAAPSAGHRGFPDQRIRVRGGCCLQRLDRGAGRPGMLAERVGRGFGDPGVGVAQEPTRTAHAAVRPSPGATSAARRRTRASTSRAASRHARALTRPRRGAHQGRECDRADARLGVTGRVRAERRRVGFDREPPRPGRGCPPPETLPSAPRRGSRAPARISAIAYSSGLALPIGGSRFSRGRCRGRGDTGPAE